MNLYFLKAASPFIVVSPIVSWVYFKRKNNINHPIMQRSLLHLKKDQRILDYCGENIRPGFWITVNRDPIENYVKFGFTLKGDSGSLGTSVIADYLTHRELKILD